MSDLMGSRSSLLLSMRPSFTGLLLSLGHASARRIPPNHPQNNAHTHPEPQAEPVGSRQAWDIGILTTPEGITALQGDWKDRACRAGGLALSPGTQWGVDECRGMREGGHQAAEGIPSDHKAAWQQVQDSRGEEAGTLARQHHTLAETLEASGSSSPLRTFGEEKPPPRVPREGIPPPKDPVSHPACWALLQERERDLREGPLPWDGSDLAGDMGSDLPPHGASRPAGLRTSSGSRCYMTVAGMCLAAHHGHTDSCGRATLNSLHNPTALGPGSSQSELPAAGPGWAGPTPRMGPPPRDQPRHCPR